MWDLHRIKSDLIALALFAATLFIGLSMLSFDPGDPPGRLVHPVRDVPLNLCFLAAPTILSSKKRSAHR
jgi:S-DNA-T family DNA segregation ATPase FtsK/SpoIIIE